jgi:XTP/dITP diphosphohydrolase
MLDGSGFDVTTPADCGLAIEVDETGDTYEANATLKAIAYARASGLLSLADDSGIEVDALDGRPGVHSARYGGPGLDDAGRTALLLHELEGVPAAKRTARYVAVIAIAEPRIEDGAPVELFRGVQEGRIAHAPRGANGFGYDPVFLVGETTTQAELSEAAKDRISHRGQALRAARTYLQGRYAC